jgi:hypothetical protein
MLFFFPLLQLLQNSSTFLETSVTAMSFISYSRGIRNGWLSKDVYVPIAVQVGFIMRFIDCFIDEIVLIGNNSLGVR